MSSKKKKPVVLVIMGNGSAPRSVLETGILDALESGDVKEIAIAWYESESDNVVIYDVLSRNDFPLYIYVDDPAGGKKLPKVIDNMAEDVLHTDTLHVDMLVDSMERAQELDAEMRVLLLWDDNDPVAMEEIVYRCADNGVPVLDMSNGLVPITVEDDEDDEEATSPAAADPDGDEVDVAHPVVLDDSAPFTSEELANMPLAALKRMAIAQGKDVPSRASKAVLIDLLLEGVTIPVPTEDEEVAPVAPAAVPAPVVEVAPQPVAVVIYNNGVSITINVDEHVRPLLKDLINKALTR